MHYSRNIQSNLSVSREEDRGRRGFIEDRPKEDAFILKRSQRLLTPTCADIYSRVTEIVLPLEGSQFISGIISKTAEAHSCCCRAYFVDWLQSGRKKSEERQLPHEYSAARTVERHVFHSRLVVECELR